jgi:hypothetical protein
LRKIWAAECGGMWRKLAKQNWRNVAKRDDGENEMNGYTCYLLINNIRKQFKGLLKEIGWLIVFIYSVVNNNRLVFSFYWRKKKRKKKNVNV